MIVDTMLKQLKHRDEINIVSYCHHIQKQCSELVVSEEQYVFVHDVLSESVSSGETLVHTAQLTQYIKTLQSLQSPSPDGDVVSSWQLLNRQYKLATSRLIAASQYISALTACNQHKNQSLDFLPVEDFRVVLQGN